MSTEFFVVPLDRVLPRGTLPGPSRRITVEPLDVPTTTPGRTNEPLEPPREVPEPGEVPNQEPAVEPVPA